MAGGAIPGPVMAQMQAILERDPQADRIALVWPEPLDPAETMQQVSGTPLRIVYCPSELAMRERVVTHEGGDTRLVMLTPFDETRLAKDLLARLWGHEPKRISPWRTLEQLLHVKQIDPRLTGKPYRWIAEALVSSYDRYRSEIPFGEVLGFDEAWRALALGLLGYRSESLDIESLLSWSRGEGVSDAVAALPEEMMAHLGEWLEPRLGRQAPLVHSLWRAGHAAEMLPIGLVCSLLYRDGEKPSQEIFQARGRLAERFLGGAKIGAPSLKAFGESASSYVDGYLKGHPYSDLGVAFSHAEQILASLDLMPLAVASDLFPAAFTLRLDRFAKALKRSIGGKAVQETRDALAALQRHRLAGVRQDQVRTAELAVRACAWLQTDGGEGKNARAEIEDYIRSGGYLDWARSRIWSGDEHEAVSQAYRQLAGKLLKRRERINQRFSRHLPAVARGDRIGAGILPVERALDERVAPLARQQPVLLLVLDGMSQAVYRELSDDLLRHSWVELQQEAGTGPGCLLAALPTITRVSRYALLAGALGEGTSADEKRAFAGHPALKSLASTRFPPRLFHKADLQQPGSGALAGSVREVIAGREHRIVGAVINAVDDQLGSGAQLSVSWSIESVSLLRQLLEAAREAGRLVIVTSDHGHVLDHDMRLIKAATDAERFKPATERVAAGEMLVEGARVVQPGGKVILPWSEKIRYTAKKMGYHGGGTPQEMVIPLGVYRNAGETDPIEGWHEVPRQEPDWWRLDARPERTPEARPVTPPPGRGKRPKPDEHTPDLFEQAGKGAAAPGDGDDCLQALFRSPVYGQMKARAGRVVIGEEKLQQLLRVLVEGGGQQMTGALVQALGIPSIRLNGFLAGAQKLLNVDGYPILSIDRPSRTVKLNIGSLKQQFEL